MNRENDYFDEDMTPQPTSEANNKSTTLTDSADKETAPAAADATSANNEKKSDSATPDAKAAKPKKRRSHFWLWFLLILIVAIGVGGWLRYFNPYVEARETGYVTLIERRGIIFKTYEGEMITESSLTDTTRVYSRDFIFSIVNPALADSLQNMQGNGKKVTVTYERYYGVLPWRGSQPIIVTGIVNPSTAN